MTFYQKPPVSRRHASNFTQKQAKSRIAESVATIQEKGKNALFVDGLEVLLYKQEKSTKVCTCKKTEISAEHPTTRDDIPPNIKNPESDSDLVLKIDYGRALFGTPSLERRETPVNKSFIEYAEDDDDLIDEVLMEGEVRSIGSENLFSSGSDCGICYNCGYLPGYSLYGWDRQVLTTSDITDILGYHIEQNLAPHVLAQQDTKGFVEFSISVPYYFTRCKYSIRNNDQVIEDIIYYEDHQLTLSDLTQNKGGEILIRCTAFRFTHIVFEFDLGLSLYANVAQQSKTLDWTMFDTLGNMNVVLPATISEVASTDIIVILTRKQVLKVTDTPILRTSADQNLDWSVNTRIVQPQEPLKRINYGIWL